MILVYSMVDCSLGNSSTKGLVEGPWQYQASTAWWAADQPHMTARPLQQTVHFGIVGTFYFCTGVGVGVGVGWQL